MSNVRIQIVLYKNSIKEVEAALDSAIISARSAKLDFQIILGSNSPQKNLNHGYLSLVNKYKKFVDIQLIVSRQNLGHGGMHNHLFFHDTTPSEYLLILNPDGLLGPKTLSRMIDRALPSNVGAVEPRQLPFEHPKVFDVFTGETTWASGACLLVKSEVFSQIGGFDTRFFLHCDDVDLSWRIRNEGLKLIYSVDSIFFHDKKIAKNGHPEMSESERYFGPLGALLIAHKYNLKSGLKFMMSDLKKSSDPIHREILDVFDWETSIHKPLKINREIPKYVHPWKFSETRY
jgi:hypothetical protein